VQLIKTAPQQGNRTMVLDQVRNRLVLLAATLMAVAGLLAAASHAQATAIAAHYTYKHSDCTTYQDPLNVRWFNIDWTGVKVGMESYMYKWGTMLDTPLHPQYAMDQGTCEVENYSAGRQWGSYVGPTPGFRKHKIHARYFTTGVGQVGGDAHIERKITTGHCADQTIGMNDAVYAKYNGTDGFTAAMQKVVTAYRKHSSSTVSVLKAKSPFTNVFKQCNGSKVKWGGNVAYITRP